MFCCFLTKWEKVIVSQASFCVNWILIRWACNTSDGPHTHVTFHVIIGSIYLKTRNFTFFNDVTYMFEWQKLQISKLPASRHLDCRVLKSLHLYKGSLNYKMARGENKNGFHWPSLEMSWMYYRRQGVIVKLHFCPFQLMFDISQSTHASS